MRRPNIRWPDRYQYAAWLATATAFVVVFVLLVTADAAACGSGFPVEVVEP